MKAAQDRGFKYSAYSPNPPVLCESAIDGGLLIISRLPIVE